MCQQAYYTWCAAKPKPFHKKPCKCCVEVENEIEVKQDIKDLKGGDGGDGGEGGSPGGAGGNVAATQNVTAVIDNDTTVNCGTSWAPVSPPTPENTSK